MLSPDHQPVPEDAKQKKTSVKVIAGTPASEALALPRRSPTLDTFLKPWPGLDTLKSKELFSAVAIRVACSNLSMAGTPEAEGRKGEGNDTARDSTQRFGVCVREARANMASKPQSTDKSAVKWLGVV